MTVGCDCPRVGSSHSAHLLSLEIKSEERAAAPRLARLLKEESVAIGTGAQGTVNVASDKIALGFQGGGVKNTQGRVALKSEDNFDRVAGLPIGGRNVRLFPERNQRPGKARRKRGKRQR